MPHDLARSNLEQTKCLDPHQLVTDEHEACVLAGIPFLGDETEEREDQLTETKSILANIEHIKTIVQMQQSLAHFGGIEERFDATELFEEAVKISLAGSANHQLRIVRNFDGPSEVIADRQKVLQILVNLIGNAIDAVNTSSKENNEIELAIAIGECGNIEFSIADNGIGINTDDLTQIFHFGFTTKGADGNGFGLHSSALAAGELMGNLSVKSDGIEKGACFTLSIPTKPAKSHSAEMVDSSNCYA